MYYQRERGRGGGSSNRQFTCRNCGQPGHSIENCPFKASGSRSGQRGFGGDKKCFNCKKYGHISSHCPEERTESGDFRPSYRGGHYGDKGGRGYSGQSYSHQGRGRNQGSRGSLAGGIETTELKDESKMVKPSMFPERKIFGYGTLGKPVKLAVNYFKLSFKPTKVYHYDVEIKEIKKYDTFKDNDSDEKRKKLRRNQRENREIFGNFFKANQEHFTDKSGRKAKQFAYDGRNNFYSGIEFDSFEKVFCSKIDGPERKEDGNVGRETELLITVRKAKEKVKGENEVEKDVIIDVESVIKYYNGKVDEVPMKVQQAIQIILKAGPTEKQVPIGRSIYPQIDKRNKVSLNRQNKQICFGYSQALKMTEAGPVLNVDRSCTMVYQVPESRKLIDFIKGFLPEFDPMKELGHNQRLKLIEHLKGIKIYSYHLEYKRAYFIDNISEYKPQQVMFDRDGQWVSVEQHFEEKFKRALKEGNGKLQYKNLPCIVTRGQNKNNLPMELLYVYSDQPVQKKKVEPEDTAEMVRVCGAQKPKERFYEIKKAVESIKEDSKDYLFEFEIELETKPMQVPGRVLEKPQTQGLEKKFYKPMNLEKWTFYDLSGINLRKTHQEFIKMLIDQGAILGMKISEPNLIVRQNLYEDKLNSERFLKQVFENAKKEKWKLILFVLRRKSILYELIKTIGEVDSKNIGIASQCVLADNFGKPIQNKLLYKINTKLGGITRRVTKGFLADLQDTIIIGADVTHPAPGDKLETSIAGCVGSYDNEFCKYSARVSVQERAINKKSIEEIKDLKNLIKELLGVYYNKNQKYPKLVLYFRDGVSVSQLATVLNDELPKIRDAFNEKGAEKPKITFINVQKRHHTRFIVLEDNENVSPGTVVDRLAVHPSDFDYYLASQKGLQGTSRPSHYYVLHDDKGFSADQLQGITYDMVYNYSRCGSTISIPPAVKYADLAAFRARDHIAAQRTDKPWQRFENFKDEERHLKELVKKYNQYVKVCPELNDMYYC